MDALYYVVDVFTSQRFAGNPLAVFPRAEAIPEALLQRIAGELNLSETAFVFPPAAGGTRRVRIFTPRAELPFAGHPTIGTAWLLATLGELKLADGAADVVLEEGVGPVPIEIREIEGGKLRVRCTAAVTPFAVAPACPPELLARALGLEIQDIDLALGGSWSAGIPKVVVAVRTRQALARISVDLATLGEVLERGRAGGLYAVVVGEGTVAARMFAPGLGVPEDPATGSAALALAGALAARGLIGPDGTHAVVIGQGEDMGRPSRLELEVELEAGHIRAAHLAGTAVLVSSAAMRLV